MNQYRYRKNGFVIFVIMLLGGCYVLYISFVENEYAWNNFSSVLDNLGQVMDTNGAMIIYGMLMVFLSIIGIISLIRLELSPIKKIIVKLVDMKYISSGSLPQKIQVPFVKTDRKTSQWLDSTITSGDKHFYFLTFVDAENKKYTWKSNLFSVYEVNTSYYVQIRGGHIIGIIDEVK